MIHKLFQAYQLHGVTLFHQYAPQGSHAFHHHSVSNTKHELKNNKDIKTEKEKA